MTPPRARIFDVRARRHADPQQLALFASSTPRNDGDHRSSTFVGPTRNNPYRCHVLRMREAWAAEAARRDGAVA